jgi:hypothetical protein
MDYLHKRIKRFELSGQILDDSFIPKMRGEYIRLLSDLMKETGYVQRYDIGPDWSLSYTGNYYEFVLSLYGSYVGRRSATCIEGLDKNHPIYTQANRLKGSSPGQEQTLNQK